MATIRIRQVPDEVHRKLRTRAAATGQSLQQYMLESICRQAETAGIEELLASKRIEAMMYGATHLDRAAIVAVIRADRESR